MAGRRRQRGHPVQVPVAVGPEGERLLLRAAEEEGKLLRGEQADLPRAVRDGVWWLRRGEAWARRPGVPVYRVPRRAWRALPGGLLVAARRGGKTVRVPLVFLAEPGREWTEDGVLALSKQPGGWVAALPTSG